MKRKPSNRQLVSYPWKRRRAAQALAHRVDARADAALLAYSQKLKQRGEFLAAAQRAMLSIQEAQGLQPSSHLFHDVTAADRAGDAIKLSCLVPAVTVAPPAPTPPCPDLQPALAQLLHQWDRQIKSRMQNAQQEGTEHGRRFIEHGAVCIFNCAMDLKRVLLEGQTGQAARDLGLEVIQQDTKRP